MPKDVRIYDNSELKVIYTKLNTVRGYLEEIDFDSKDKIKIKTNPKYLRDAISLTKEVRDMF